MNTALISPAQIRVLAALEPILAKHRLSVIVGDPLAWNTGGALGALNLRVVLDNEIVMSIQRSEMHYCTMRGGAALDENIDFEVAAWPEGGDMLLLPDTDDGEQVDSVAGWQNLDRIDTLITGLTNGTIA